MILDYRATILTVTPYNWNHFSSSNQQLAPQFPNFMEVAALGFREEPAELARAHPSMARLYHRDLHFSNFGFLLQ